MMHLQHNSFYVNFLFKTYRWLFCQHRLIKNYYMTNNIVQVYLCTTKEHLNFKNIFQLYILYWVHIIPYVQYGIPFKTDRNLAYQKAGFTLICWMCKPSCPEENQNLKESLCLKLLTCCPIHAIHEPYVD